MSALLRQTAFQIKIHEKSAAPLSVPRRVESIRFNIQVLIYSLKIPVVPCFGVGRPSPGPLPPDPMHVGAMLGPCWHYWPYFLLLDNSNFLSAFLFFASIFSPENRTNPGFWSLKTFLKSIQNAFKIAFPKNMHFSSIFA